MRQLELWAFSYLLNSLWQAPLLFALGWLLARALRSTGCAVEHRIWVIVLCLQSLLPAISLLPHEWLRVPLWWGGHNSQSGQAEVSIMMGSGASLNDPHVREVALTSLTLIYGMAITYFFARFIWRSKALSTMRKEVHPVNLAGEAAKFWERCTKNFAIDNVSIAASSRIAGPVTMGVHRQLVLLPVPMVGALPEADFETVIAHEFAHMYRRDFLKNLIYESLSLPVAYHPMLWLTRTRIMESREMICDEIAAGMNGRKDYARSLLRVARWLLEGTHPVTPHAIGIFDANVFERRIMKLTRKQKEVSGMRRAAMVVASTALGLVVCGSTLAMAIHVNPDAEGDHNQAAKAPPLSIPSGVMAANILTKANPIYPVAAKKAKIQGRVVLQAVIGKDGKIENLRVVSGPKQLQQSALDAVRQWTYKPHLLNGYPVELETTINVVYSLAG